MGWSMVAVAVGAALGGVLRWELSVRYNALFSVVPMGTLLANLLGGYIVGLAMAFFAQLPSLAPEWRLLIVTGFCGGLTTFSTFSAEVVGLLQQGRLLWGLAAMALHLLGSLLMTLCGAWSWQWMDRTWLT
ncbi:MAG: fluoride efflux transporter CrcB [Magnetococcales bacterium]|nr:fluoride efflux transporter CrcB [Magnetococcales bacterium]NGZ06771.1 fluoride efflux transporter CrcB [Magnetococcales bacterium]